MIRLRVEPTLADHKLIWENRNENGTREWFFSGKEFTFDEHMSWYKSKTLEPGFILYMADAVMGSGNHWHPIGVFSLDIKDRTAEFGRAVIFSQFRGQGYGWQMLEAAEARAKRRGAYYLTTVTKINNIPMQKIAKKCGMECVDTLNGNMYFRKNII